MPCLAGAGVECRQLPHNAGVHADRHDQCLVGGPTRFPCLHAGRIQPEPGEAVSNGGSLNCTPSVAAPGTARSPGCY